jgi:hypothetical protein
VGTYATSAASPSITQVVNQDPTATAVISSSNPSVAGQSVTYTAIVTAKSPGAGNPTGNEEFFDGGATISGCAAQPASGTASDTASCLVTYVSTAASPHTITVQCFNPGTYDASPVLTSISQVVARSTTTSVVGASGTPSVVGRAVTYTATMTAAGWGNPTGSVELFEDGTAITVCGGTTGVTLGGSATAICAVAYTSTGGHKITAEYLGNPGTYAASSVSSSIAQTVRASGAATGSSTGNLVTGTDRYQLPSASAGSATSTQNSCSAGTATTLTSFTFTIRGTTAATQTATIGPISGGTWTATGLTCAITGGSGLKTRTTVLSVPIPRTNSVNLHVVGGGANAVTGTWTTTHAQP